MTYSATQHSTTFRVYLGKVHSDSAMVFIVDHNGKGWQAQKVVLDTKKKLGVVRVGEIKRVHPNDRYDYDKIAAMLLI